MLRNCHRKRVEKRVLQPSTSNTLETGQTLETSKIFKTIIGSAVRPGRHRYLSTLLYAAYDQITSTNNKKNAHVAHRLRRCASAGQKKNLTEMGFEPMHTNILAPEANAIDHSATQPYKKFLSVFRIYNVLVVCSSPQSDPHTQSPTYKQPTAFPVMNIDL